MLKTVQIVEVDHEPAILLPDEALSQLNTKIGDEVEVVTIPYGIELKAKGSRNLTA